MFLVVVWVSVGLSDTLTHLFWCYRLVRLLQRCDSGRLDRLAETTNIESLGLVRLQIL